jgi:hypothetical protein
MEPRFTYDAADPASAWKVTADILIFITLLMGILRLMGIDTAGLALICLVPMAIPVAGLRVAPFLLRWVGARLAARRPLKAGEIELGKTVEYPHIPIRMDGREREGHTVIFGRNGSGKSTQMKAMAEQDIACQRPIIVIDPHRSLARQCTHITLCDGRCPIVLEPHPRYMNTLNLLETWPGYGPLDAALTVTDGLIQVYVPYQDELPVRIRHLLMAALYTLSAAGEGHTILELPRWILQSNFREFIARKALETTKDGHSIEVAQVLSSIQWLESLKPTQRYDQTQSVFTRIAALLTHRDVQRILGSSQSSFKFEQIRSGTPLLVGIGEENMHRTGYLLNALVISWITAQLFGGGRQEPIHVYGDELAEYSPQTFELLLRHARKLSVPLAISGQAHNMLRSPLAETIMANIATVMIFPLSGPAVDSLAREVSRPDATQRRAGWDGGFMELPRQFHEMASAIRDLPKHEFYLWRAAHPGKPVHCRTRNVHWNLPGALDTATTDALQWRGRRVELIDDEIRQRSARLDAQFGPLHDFGVCQPPKDMAPW